LKGLVSAVARERTKMSLPKIELWTARDERTFAGNRGWSDRGDESTAGRLLLGEDGFVSMLYLERRRAERAEKRFVLMLVDVKRLLDQEKSGRVLSRVTGALGKAIRETDLIGWYLEGQLIGVIGTEIGNAKPKSVQDRMYRNVRESLDRELSPQKSALISVSFHFFPEEWEQSGHDRGANIALYPEIARQGQTKKVALGIKRAIDIVGSALALLLLFPLYALVALAIKLTSKGPILFRQERLGQYGKSFTLLKFRSMRTDCDPRIHQEFVNEFIKGGSGDKDSAQPLYKIKNDPRVTRIGSLLRRTSLDELPQFWNVLRGDMSLVGPRPPIAYEFKTYGLWHQRRVLEIKPGITGLWQVTGRSRTRFDEMVRLDLKYARAWNLWLDLKILLRTPAAVFSGDGAH
jgi:lipopolysaccharide/colanic/teichoic acid biosynthesis glycosyltransferase